jgi:hypothetical protein
MKRNLFILTVTLLAFWACGKNEQKTNAAQSRVPTMPAGSATPDAGIKIIPKLEKAACENPIILEDSQLTPLTDLEKAPKGKFKLVELQTHALWQSSNNSLFISSKEADQFLVKVDCNGTRTEGNEKLEISFDISTLLDTVTLAESMDLRVIEVRTENGQVTAANSRAFKGQARKEKQEKIALERMKVGEDIYMTIRAYAVSEDRLEIRIKIEYKADKDGKRLLQMAKAVYERLPQ